MVPVPILRTAIWYSILTGTILPARFQVCRLCKLFDDRYILPQVLFIKDHFPRAEGEVEAPFPVVVQFAEYPAAAIFDGVNRVGGVPLEIAGPAVFHDDGMESGHKVDLKPAVRALEEVAPVQDHFCIPVLQAVLRTESFKPLYKHVFSPSFLSLISSGR